MNIHSIQKDLSKILKVDFPVLIEISDTPYTGSFTNQKAEKLSLKYGVDNKYSTSCVLSKDEIREDELPEIKSKILANGVEFRIMDIELNPAGYVFDLERVKK